jgi:hypothetical protein
MHKARGKFPQALCFGLSVLLAGCYSAAFGQAISGTACVG